MRPQLILHVNYVEQGQHLEEIFRKAEQWGYQGIELRRRRVKLTETDDQYLDEIASAYAKVSLSTIIFGSPGANLMTEDETSRRAEIESLVNFYAKAVERFPLSLGNTDVGLLKNPDSSIPYTAYERHGSFIATETHWDKAVDGLKEIGERVQAYGVRLALETHMVYLHDLPQVAGELVRLVDHPGVGVNLDYGNAVYFLNRLPLEKLLPELKQHLWYVHLKNSIPFHDFRVPTGLADGEINHRQFLTLLKQQGYEGPICLEAPRSGDREWYAQQDIVYVNRILDDLNWN